MPNDELRSRMREFPDHKDQVLDGDGRPLRVTSGQSNDGMFFLGLVVIVAAVVVGAVVLALTA